MLIALQAILSAMSAISSTAVEPSVAVISNRVEMFVDMWLVDTNRVHGLSLKLHEPRREEVVLTLDKPWEGKDSAYFTVIDDKPKVRLYYRGYIPERGDDSTNQATCYAESSDGIHFTRPNLGLYEFSGSTSNNIVYQGIQAHNFAPFLDSNPNSKQEARYKAVGGLASQLFAFQSADGIHWQKMQTEPVATNGAFDSLNVAFWDSATGQYRCYSRFWSGGGYTGVRSVQGATSPDFIRWSEPIPNRHRTVNGDAAPAEHFYTSATTPCPGAPHYYFSFPMRFLPDRKASSPIPDPGTSDAVFLSSRDGVNWDRVFLEAWVRPGLDPRNWTHRNNMTACGIVQTSSSEFSMYISEHYAWPDNQLRRLSIRKNGFASMHANANGGEFTTRPLKFSGSKLFVNYSTSAAGSLQAEILGEDGRPLPGFSAADMTPIYGDDVDGPVQWKSNLSALGGRTVRLRFMLRDADLFALQFRN